MMEYDWYKIFNRAEFEALGLVSRTITPSLTGKGIKEILITRGQLLAITCDGVFLPASFTGANPYARDGVAIFESTNGDVYIGFEVPE